jgi:acetyl esterase/lipase
LIARVCQASEAQAFVPAYRLAPEFAFPAAVRDGIDSYRHLIAKGVDPRSVVVAGDGSGGGLAFAILLAARNAGLAMPAAAVAMSPWADLSLSGMSVLTNASSDTALNWELLFLSARNYLRKTNPCDLYASPAYASFRDFPPIMVHAGSSEMLRDDASRIGDRAAESGTPVSIEIYDGMQHVFQANPYVPEARVSLQRLGQFIKSKTPRIAAA